MADYFISRKAPLQIRLTNTGRKMIRIETVIDIMLLIPCDRCLEDVKYDLSIEVDKEINMDESDQERIRSLDELSYIKDNSLDVERFIMRFWYICL